MNLKDEYIIFFVGLEAEYIIFFVGLALLQMTGYMSLVVKRVISWQSLVHLSSNAPEGMRYVMNIVLVIHYMLFTREENFNGKSLTKQ